MSTSYQEKREHQITLRFDNKQNVERDQRDGKLYITGEYEKNGKTAFVAASWKGRAWKPTFFTRFSSPEYRSKYIEEDYGYWLRHLKTKRERSSYEHTLEVGDILVSSWGYDQTNIDFYQVVEVVGKKTVKIQEIAQKRTRSDGCMSEYVVPVKDKFIEKAEVLTKRVRKGNYVSIASYAVASPVDEDREYNQTHYH